MEEADAVGPPVEGREVGESGWDKYEKQRGIELGGPCDDHGST
jgi:hypothetical protein